MNPFHNSSEPCPEMKKLFTELEQLTAKMFLQEAETYGEHADYDKLLNNIHGATMFELVKLKTFAFHYLNSQPETKLSQDDKVAVAAHEAYLRGNR